MPIDLNRFSTKDVCISSSDASSPKVPHSSSMPQLNKKASSQSTFIRTGTVKVLGGLAGAWKGKVDMKKMML